MNSALTASPAIIESVVKPNEVTTSQVNLENNTGFPLPIKSQVSIFLTKSKQVDISQKTLDASSWFTLSPADFILQPHEKKLVQIQITPPYGSEPGGHYATIYFEPMIPQEAMSYNSSFNLGRIGVLSFLIVPGDIEQNIIIEDFTSKNLQSFGPLNFDLTLKNDGNVHLLPTGQIVIKNIYGVEKASLALTPTTILPGTSDTYHPSWDKTLLLGRYEVTPHVNYGSDQPMIVGEPIFVWVFPWPLMKS